ncbi:MAG: sigma-70 family RNA polymerase sigma factor [Lewinella sp.]|nr:sigma-70 family RNA polymerase sigma factor [Lewinella sp.]
MPDSRRTLSAEELEAEWQLIQAAQADPARFRPLYERYYEPIYRFLFRRTADADLTADLCSQVFLKALQRLGMYTFQGVPFSAWLFRIASNEMAQYFRQHSQQRFISADEVQLGDIAEEIETTATTDLLEELAPALDHLRPDELLLIEMRYFEQRPFKEIADILGLKEGNTKVKTYRILEKMKRFIQNQSPTAG